MKLRNLCRCKARQGGFTVIEIMLSLMLASVMLLGLSRIFVATNEANRMIAGQLRLQESAGYALRHLAEQLRSAGDFGCAARFSTPLKTLRGSWQQLFEFDLTSPLGGIGGSSFSQSLATQRLALAAPVDNSKTYVGRRGIRASPFVPGSASRASALLVTDSDILVTRRLGVPHFRLTAPVQATDEIIIRLNDLNNDGRVNLSDLNRFGFSGSRDPILLLGDCSYRTLFRASQLRRQGNVVRLTRQTPTSGNSFTSNSANLLPAGEAFHADAVVGPVTTSVFFVATGLGVNGAGEPVLSLWSKVGINRPQELVEGIEQLIFYAGVDTDGDRIPNQYQPLARITNFGAIVTMRIMIVANSVDAVRLSRTAEPRLLRRAFSTTVWLRNL